ncbi:hypothetical protein EG350_14620 [Chryseobacterium shandongense]|nr:hypothetical protein EG350_14620 [Chryseobacterium shandongense]
MLLLISVILICLDIHETTNHCVRDRKGGEERAGAERSGAPKRSVALDSPTFFPGPSAGEKRARPDI